MKVLVKDAVRRHRPWDIARFAKHLPQFVRLFLRLLGDRRVSVAAKAVLLGAVAYVLSPVDFLTDLAPVIGQMDDLALLAMAGRAFVTLCPRTVVDQHVSELDPRGGWRPF